MIGNEALRFNGKKGRLLHCVEGIYGYTRRDPDCRDAMEYIHLKVSQLLTYTACIADPKISVFEVFASFHHTPDLSKYPYRHVTISK